jgi:hypothetical protein
MMMILANLAGPARIVILGCEGRIGTCVSTLEAYAIQAGSRSGLTSLLAAVRPDLVDDDLDAAVLRLPDAGGGRYQKMRFAEALDRDRAGWHAVLDQFRCDSLGALD